VAPAYPIHSLVLNPRRCHYKVLKAHLSATFEDAYFGEDAICMEREFKRRIRIIDANTEAVCDFLRSRSLAAGATKPAIKEVFYPKYVTTENYDHCRIKRVDPDDGNAGGYGGLLSLTFTSGEASKAFSTLCLATRPRV